MKDYGLTKTESRVRLMLEMGYTTRQIAEFMVVSMETVKTHKRHIRKKMGDDYPRRQRKPLARALVATSTGEILFGAKIIPIPKEEDHGTNQMQDP